MSIKKTINSIEVFSHQLEKDLAEIAENPSLWRTKKSAILSNLDGLLRTEEGLGFIYTQIEKIESAGLFEGSSWEQINHLIPSLVRGTICAGFPMVIYESLSEIRMLKIAVGEYKHPNCSPEEALQFLQEALIHSFDLAFDAGTEESRYQLSKNSLHRIQLLFQFVLSKIPLEGFKEKLLQEVSEVLAHRPIVLGRMRQILSLLRDRLEFDPTDVIDQELNFFVDACFHPSSLSKSVESVNEYPQKLEMASEAVLKEEVRQMGHSMNRTGLVSPFHIVLLRFLLARKDMAKLGDALDLSPHGKAELSRHEEFVAQALEEFISPGRGAVIYGLSKLLNRTLLSRRAVYQSMMKLLKTRIHPLVAKKLSELNREGENLSPLQILGGGIIQILGQPLGIGQGMNPTCQSARGISMWSKHSPAKLMGMLLSVLASNQLTFRFQGELISSSHQLEKRITDGNLDPVSVVLVPHLDNIYQQMILRAQQKFPLQDPHVTVNPAFYGQWIPTGFISCYNHSLNMIQDYDYFVRLFYAAFHPDYNGGFRLIYPLPLGIIITTSRGEFLGFHAISLLRVARDEEGVVRAYFFNPNNDGRQDWGQDIRPTVMGNGEKYGESSLPFHQFISRIYAFHYNSFEAKANLEKIGILQEAEKVKSLAKESWGRNYFWD